MSSVITFYSYKGGVGRTMSLANIAVLLSHWGHKVLMVDWDLEAPGLEHFFAGKDKEYIDIEVVKDKIGLIDLLDLDNLLDWHDAIIPINVPSENRTRVPNIDFISAGRRDDDYFKKVRNFHIDDFYANGGGTLIERLRNEWKNEYDYVLIDSRTGVTEIGGICTIQLPDIIVLLFTATEQGFEGVLDIAKRASDAQQKLPYDRQKLAFLPIPTKFDTQAEFKLSQDWLNIFAEKLTPLYNDWLPGRVNKKHFLELTKVPYISYFSFGEKLPVVEQGVKEPTGLGYAYENIALLLANNLDNAVDLMEDRKKMTTEVPKKVKIFISYSKKDRNFAQFIASSLKNIPNVSAIFYDRHNMVAGSNIRETVNIWINSADVVIVVLSSNFFDDSLYDDTKNLIDTNNNKKIIPILLENYLKEYHIVYGISKYKFLALPSGEPFKDLERMDKQKVSDYLIKQFKQILLTV